ncbi:acetyl-CoA carboxylase carboxyl transferase subunit alpha/beta [Streptomyces sp. NBC_00390]|uniref:carboxyl transferase domain-containing protein n=1 Tax=Streptomyces sp. NBC_00390 TaxID=2975736 RepID=UPI002E237583
MAERASAREAIALICDDFTEHHTAQLPEVGEGPIGWDGYGASRDRAARRTGSPESVVHGEATLGDGRRCVVIAFEFGFLGGSLSRRAGDRLEAAYALARERRLPLVSLIATGGSRMQEGMVALTQLQRVARASVLLREAGVAHIAVLRDPTTGGGWATLGAGADVVLALPGAQVGFAGSRVRPADADPAAYTAEGQLAAGQIDAIVRPQELRATVEFWVTALGPAAGQDRTAADASRAEPVPGGRHGPPGGPEADAGDSDTGTTGPIGRPADGSAPGDAPAPGGARPASRPDRPGRASLLPAGGGETGEVGSPPGGTEAEAAAPAGGRPGAPRVGHGPADGSSPEEAPAPGDASAHGPNRPGEAEAGSAPGADCPQAPDAGRGAPRVQPVPPPHALGAAALPATGWDAVRQAREPGRARAGAYLEAYFTRREPLRGDRSGGVDPGVLCGVGVRDGRPVAFVAQCGTPTLPAGYRTAARVVRLADRLGIPVLTLIDTPGAANDAAAEHAGAGAAIAELFAAMAAARTPLTSLLIGEGGSGGALALAAPGNTWATPDSYFSVIAPELAAAILKRDPAEVPRTADQLRLRPQDLVELGVVRGVVGPAAV